MYRPSSNQDRSSYMSSRFTRLFKPVRGHGSKTDSDQFSLSVSSVSSSTDATVDFKEDSKKELVKTGTNTTKETASLTTASTQTTQTIVEPADSAMILGSSVLVGGNESVSSFGTASVNTEVEAPMRFTDAEAKLLRWSWNENISSGKGDPKSKLNSISEAFSSCQFWEEIYTYVNMIDEDLRKILPSPSHQTGYFTGIVRMAVLSASDLSVMNDYLRSIGRRHGILFGAEPGYFQTVGIAVVRALNDRFGEDFTPQLEHVWILLYCYLANAMIESCSVDPVFPEDVSAGLITIQSDDQKLKKKKSVFNANGAGGAATYASSRRM